VAKKLSNTTPRSAKKYFSPGEEIKELFPVVGIGASSGGLQAVSDLLENIPHDLGMAYVIIQHLSPKHESILPELLSKKTPMPVRAVEHGMKIQPNNVYVIAPNTFISLIDSVLTLSERVKTNSVYHAIDFFLNALAPVYQTKAIAIILSGSGTDGTVGIESIKAYGGITFAQDETAAFPGMPKSASDSGYTDYVMPCKLIAKELATIARTPNGLFTMNEMLEANEEPLKAIQVMLHNKKGVDFSYYKQTTVHRRITRRMALNKFHDLSAYIKFLKENPHELDLLYKDLLINVTSFFRDPKVYRALTRKIFPAVFRNRKDNEVVRIWVPACANGEEAYSMAICLFDFLKEKSLNTPIQIFGTDLNDTAISRARSGIYNEGSLHNVSTVHLERYFKKTDGRYQIIKPVRDICIFATHNLLKDPPFSHMDVISCQNVLIYIESNPQRKILHSFHYSLKPAGYLLLGKSESVGTSTDLFTQIDKELKVYTKKDLSPGHNIFDFSLRPSASLMLPPGKYKHESTSEIDIEKESDRLLLSRYVPASVVINKDLQILRFHGPTSNYLQPSTGKASLNLLKMVKDELVFDLKGLFNRARKENIPVRKEKVLLSQNGTEKEIAIEVVPIKSPGKDIYYLVLFRDGNFVAQEKAGTTGKDRRQERVTKLEQKLIEAREYMKTMSEEFETTREELQSANEEILSSNEELQSINEELETSKEELQSTNEELMTINEELLLRNNELRQASDFNKAIVETINEPILVLTPDMKIDLANKAFFELFKTNNDRTEGHYFFEMAEGQWNIPELKEKLSGIIEKHKTFDNCEVTKVFPGIGEKTLLFNAMRMEQPDSKKNRILVVVQDMSNMRNNKQN
jgi:two-component system, chemotaxis family, CheB/CheR fusion protein